MSLAVIVVGLAGQTAAWASVKISKKPTQNMSCSGGVCSPTAKKAVLNVNDLAQLLAGGNATIKSGQLAQDIEIDAALSWTSTNRLTLDAYGSITFNKPVKLLGAGALTIATNDGGTGGDFRFVGRGHAKFSDVHSALTINGQRYQLFKSFKAFRREFRHGAGTRKFYAQAGNWDMSGSIYSASPIDIAFEGAFEGLGNAISHMTIHEPSEDRSTALGFFGGVSLTGVVRDITLTDVDVAGMGSVLRGAGALAGGSAGVVSNARVTGQVSSTVTGVEVGGLLGTNGGMVSDSSANIAVSGNTETLSGGLVGHNLSLDGYPAIVQDSYASGTVSGGSAIGGLIGKMEGGNVSNSYSSATVTGSEGASAGGLIGAFAPGYSAPRLSASYSTGIVSEGAFVGGLIGQDLVGSGIADSYWDMDTSGISDPARGAGNVANDPGITGLTTQQLKSGLPAGFSPSIWKEKAKINNGYPYLLDNSPE